MPRLKKVAITLIALGCIGLLWLGGAFAFLPSDRAVARAFVKRHPDLEVVRVVRLGGDEDQFEFDVYYRDQASEKEGLARWFVYTSGVQFGWELDSEQLDRNH